MNVQQKEARPSTVVSRQIIARHTEEPQVVIAAEGLVIDLLENGHNPSRPQELANKLFEILGFPIPRRYFYRNGDPVLSIQKILFFLIMERLEKERFITVSTLAINPRSPLHYYNGVTVASKNPLGLKFDKKAVCDFCHEELIVDMASWLSAYPKTLRLLETLRSLHTDDWVSREVLLTKVGFTLSQLYHAQTDLQMCVDIRKGVSKAREPRRFKYKLNSLGIELSNQLFGRF